MRPLRLELTGFTSFRQKATIDFSGLDLFAITGPTGAGKSSLIDALTYALYGETPRAGGNIGELISLGANRAEVYLEFTTGRSRYRITRTVRRTKTSVNSDRRLEVLQEDGEWLALTDRERETREKILEIVGLDFKGFTKSVVLPQGEFDRFLKGDAGERRKILIALLQLRVYEEMGRRARERAKDANSRAATLKGQLETHYQDATPERHESLKRDLARMREEHAALVKKLESVRAAETVALEIRRARADQDRQRAELTSANSQLEGLRESHQKNLSALAGAESELEDLRGRIEALTYDADHHLALSGLKPKAERLRALLTTLSDQDEKSRRLRTRLTQLDAALQEAKRREQVDSAASSAAEAAAVEAWQRWQKALEDHGQPAAIRALGKELRDREGCVSDKQSLTSQIQELERKLKDGKLQLKQLTQESSTAESACREARRRLENLRLSHSAERLRDRLQPGHPCPVCQRTVTEVPSQGEHPALDSAEETARRREEEWEQAKLKVSRLEAALQALPRQRELLEKNLSFQVQRLVAWDERLTKTLGKAPGTDPVRELKELALRQESWRKEADQRREEADQASARAQAGKQAHSQAQHEVELAQKDLTSSLENHRRDHAESEQLTRELGAWSDLARLDRELEKLSQVQRQRSALLQKRETLLTKIERLRKASTEAGKEIHLLEATRVKIEASLSDLGTRLEGLRSRLSDTIHDLVVDDSNDEAGSLALQRIELERGEREIADAIAGGKEKLAQLAQRIQQATEIGVQAKELDTAAAIAHELGRTLGAGFITFIQEEALRRLAEGGTIHLLTLSSDRFSFSVDGGNFFVIDHWNADEIRPVSTLSGGESFLASLSLALSLAESLAEFCTDRERTTLESLFLDEGFSTLDPETLDIVFQGIERLAASDRMIGVVSHIPDLADRFPQRIHVRKAIGGSTVEMK